MVNNGYKRHEYIDLLKFFLAACVVLIHCKVYIPTQSQSVEAFVRFSDFISEFLLSNVVPNFFILSGILFFKDGIPLTSSGYYKKIKKRFKNLVLPYFIWNTIGLMLFLIKISPLLISAFPQYADIPPTFMNLSEGYIAIKGMIYPYDMPLWFIRNLIIVVILTPFIGLSIRRLHSWAIPAIILFNYIVGTYLGEEPYDTIVSSILSSIAFFMCGAIIVTGYRSLLTGKYAFYFLLSYITVFTILYETHIESDFLYSILATTKTILAGIVLIKLSNIAADNGITIKRGLSASTFFIFAFHGLFCSVVSKGVCNFIPPVNSILCFADNIIIFIILFGSSLAAFAILKKICPKVLSIICGGRAS